MPEYGRLFALLKAAFITIINNSSLSNTQMVIYYTCLIKAHQSEGKKPQRSEREFKCPYL